MTPDSTVGKRTSEVAGGPPALVLDEQARDWAAGRREPVETYLKRFPYLRDHPDAILDLITQEVVLRERVGEAPTSGDYVARFPALAPRIEALFAGEEALSSVRLVDGQLTHRTLVQPAGPPPAALPAAFPSAETSEYPNVPGYEILGELGRGGMGVVYKARHLQLDRVVALKMVPVHAPVAPEVVRRFLREMKAAARLAHPNIVTVYDAGRVGDAPYFTMECLEGADLAAIVQKRGPLPPAEACEYVRQAAAGLQHALDRGLIHRDVKPANLFVTSEGVVKILDLGLARLLPGAVAPVDLTAPTQSTEEGAILGTPDFVAPEQLTAPSAADTRADLYGLGCTLYLLLTGQPPFPGGSAALKIARHLSPEHPEPVESLRPDVPPAVAAVVRKLMGKRPEDRYQTPAELVTALAFQPDRPSRRRFIVGAGAAILATAGVVAWQVTRKPDGRPQPPDEPDRRAAEALRALPAFEVTIRHPGGKEQALEPGEPLPAGPFEVTAVRVEPGELYERGFVRTKFLPAVSELRALKKIRDYGGRMEWSPAELNQLAGTPVGASLEVFESHIPLTAETLAALKRYPELARVQLHADGAEGELLKRVGELKAVTRFRFDRLPGTESARAAVTSLPATSLGLYEPEKFDRRLTDLVAAMPKLNDLFLFTGAPLDDHVEALLRAPKLEKLSLATTLTDAGLEKLRDATRLRLLAITGNKGVTKAGVEKLAGALRKCQIFWDGGAIEPTESE